MDEISNFEIENIVEKFEVSDIEFIGTRAWVTKNEAISRLHFVALSESIHKPLGGDERVKKAVLNYGKLNFFIRELVTLSIWKKNVLKELLRLKPSPSNSFPCYIVLYYEILLVGILQSILFHEESFNYIEDSIHDLVDYAVYQTAQLPQIATFLKNHRERNVSNDIGEELEAEQNRISFIVGSQCITLLRYTTDNLDKLPLSVTTALYSDHDLPVLAAQLIDLQTWVRHENNSTYKFHENEWKVWREDDPTFSKTECQVWLLARQLILNPACSKTYNLTTFRREQLSKLVRHLHDDVIDQLSVLSDLKECLLRSVNFASNEFIADCSTLIIEINEKFADAVADKYNGKWKEIAIKLSPLLIYPKIDDVKFLAESFGKCYQPLADLNEKFNTCSHCLKKATRKCSQCRQSWYCSRECQVQHWKVHKRACISK